MAKTFLACGIGHVRCSASDDVMCGPGGARNSIKDRVVGVTVSCGCSGRVVFMSNMESIFDFVSSE